MNDPARVVTPYRPHRFRKPYEKVRVNDFLSN